MVAARGENDGRSTPSCTTPAGRSEVGPAAALLPLLLLLLLLLPPNPPAVAVNWVAGAHGDWQ